MLEKAVPNIYHHSTWKTHSSCRPAPRGRIQNLPSCKAQSNEYNALKGLKGKKPQKLSAGSVSHGIVTWHVRPSTSIRICIHLYWWQKFSWVRWLSRFCALGRSGVVITRTACWIQWWSRQSMDFRQNSWIRQTVSPFNCFSFQR